MPQTRPDRSEMEWIKDFDETDEILKSRQFRNTLHDGASHWILEKTLGTLYGDAHTYRRRTEILMFARPSLMTYELELVRPALRDGLAAALDPTGTAKIAIHAIMRDALLRVSARIVGLDVDSDEDTEALRSMGDRLGEGNSAEWAVGDVDEIIRKALEAKDEFNERFFLPAQRRRLALLEAHRLGEIEDGELPDDLLMLLLRAYEDWDDDQLLRECIFYLGASASTTTHIAPHVLFEILNWVEHHPEDAENVLDTAFLRACVHETLRLHPPVPALMRAALEDVELTSGRIMHAGENVALDLNAVNRRTEVFGPDAAEFNPHRIPRKGVHGYGESFGGGPHVCPGRLIAVGATVALPKESDDSAIGVLVRLMEELFRYEVALDATDPPIRRTDTLADRYSSFPVLLRRRSASAR
jgi:cytochrome P450